jgi:hypothetical protein
MHAGGLQGDPQADGEPTAPLLPGGGAGAEYPNETIVRRVLPDRGAERSGQARSLGAAMSYFSHCC